MHIILQRVTRNLIRNRHPDYSNALQRLYTPVPGGLELAPTPAGSLPSYSIRRDSPACAGVNINSLPLNFVRVEGLEPPSLAALDPKSSVSTNSTTPAFFKTVRKYTLNFKNKEKYMCLLSSNLQVYTIRFLFKPAFSHIRGQFGK